MLSQESNRAAYNGLLRDPTWRAQYGIDALMDLAAHSTMGNIASCSNTGLYADGVHPADAGYQLIAPTAAAMLADLQTRFT